MEQRRLNYAICQDKLWENAAIEVLTDKISIHDQAEHYSYVLADLVVADKLEIDELRCGVSWANALDKEVVEVTNGNIDSLNGNDLIEAISRRIAHHAGRIALKEVGSSHGKLIYAIRRK